MNALCECEVAGWCARHKVVKTAREFQLCKGLQCTGAQSAKYWHAWERGLLANQAGVAPVAVPVDFAQGTLVGMPPVNQGLGDWMSQKITKWTGITPCGGCKERAAALNRLVPFRRGNPFYYDGDLPEFITAARFMSDTQTLAAMLPPDTSRIIGVARSGLCAATMVAMLLHRPMSIVRQSHGDLIEASNGWRLSGAIHSDGPAVFIDDTAMTGGSLKNAMPIVRRQFPTAIAAVVYASPAANLATPDLFVRHLKWPHVLEWNFANSILTDQLALDFDGILCHDCPPGHDEDGPLYADFLHNAKPLYYFRRTPIPLIVTARLEKYRAQTLDWLARHGMTVTNLVMHPAATLAERHRTDIARFKANHFQKFASQRHRFQPPLFVESDPRQAAAIAQYSGGITVCPAAGRCFMNGHP